MILFLQTLHVRSIWMDDVQKLQVQIFKFLNLSSRLAEFSQYCWKTSSRRGTRDVATLKRTKTLPQPPEDSFSIWKRKKKLVKWNKNTYHQCRRRQPLRKTAVGRKPQLEGEHTCYPLFLLCRNLKVAVDNLCRKLKSS